ncbi:MAG: hypothetical protein HDQ88_09925 [Clostridia bacterium]|nr:hypothetical protein [Clostridia bacterium]
MKKAIFLLGVILVVCLCVFTGCGDGEDKNVEKDLTPPPIVKEYEERHEHRMPKFNPERKNGRPVRQTPVQIKRIG